MTIVTRGMILLALVCGAGIATAQPAYWGYTTGSQFQLMPWADQDGYYFGVSYAGDSAPDVRVLLNGRSLFIAVRQSAGVPGSFFQNQQSRTFMLPPDADPSRMVRRDAPGRIVVAVPRGPLAAVPQW